MDHQNDQNPEGRQPRNLEDLLRLSIQNVDESNPSTGEMPPMTDDVCMPILFTLSCVIS